MRPWWAPASLGSGPCWVPVWWGLRPSWEQGSCCGRKLPIGADRERRVEVLVLAGGIPFQRTGGECDLSAWGPAGQPHRSRPVFDGGGATSIGHRLGHQGEPDAQSPADGSEALQRQVAL